MQHALAFTPARALLAGASLLLGASAHAAIHEMVCVLMSAQEVPVNVSTATGCGTFTVDTAANTLTYSIVVGGLSSAETAAHIHGAASPGVNAGVLHALAVGATKTGVWNFTEAQQGDILGGRMYVNVHTANNPGGEVRGQIVTHVADLDGAQEVPVNASAARGFGLVTFDKAAKTLSYYIVHNVVGETAAHFHAFARHGVNAGVAIALPVGSPKVGVVAYNPADEGRYLDGMAYINIHTAAFPGGEIRGQLVHTVVPINAAQEVPVNASTSVGVGLLSVDQATDTLGFDFRNTGFGTAHTAAHIHGFVPRGVNAGVVQSVGPGLRVQGAWAYGAANELAVLTGRTYYNAHTVAFPGGEIRGQLSFPCSHLGDTNGDGQINFSDLNSVLSDFGSAGGSLGGDTNGDGACNFTDLNITLSGFGQSCQ